MPFWPKDNDAIDRAIEQADTLGQQIQYGLYADRHCRSGVGDRSCHSRLAHEDEENEHTARLHCV